MLRKHNKSRVFAVIPGPSALVFVPWFRPASRIF